MRTRFFDASAIIRALESDEAFAPYADDTVITERGHIYDFARHVLKTRNAKVARVALAQLRCERIEPEDEDLITAAKLRQGRPDLSGQDALGYVLARREGLTFLTTDRAFRGMAGVEVVAVSSR